MDASEQQNRQQIEAVVSHYRRAFANLDMSLFEAVLDPQYGAIIYVPQERAQPVRGWPALNQYFESVAGAFSRVDVMTISDLFIDILGAAAYAFFTYHFEATAAAQSQPFVVDGRVTFVLHRTEDGWRIVHYHGSPPGPY